MDTVSPPLSLPSLSVAQLAASLGAPHVPVILDARRPGAFDTSDVAIPGALRIPPDDTGGAAPWWHRKIPAGRPIVVYCVHGRDVSQGIARALLDAGYYAAYFGGGISAWQATGLPTIRKQSGPTIPAIVGRPSRWITRERPKIDRIACPWLIRRFIDPSADFQFVPADQVVVAAEREHAIPYDIPRVRFAHRGEQCSFDAFLADFNLQDGALDALAKIVRGADTGRLDLAPEAAGLLAVSLGLSALHGDDFAMLEHGMSVYDALYAALHAPHAKA